jgi:hypothetical protein
MENENQSEHERILDQVSTEGNMRRYELWMPGKTSEDNKDK